MAELLVIRHGQASFGQADYDVLSELGHLQARAAGATLRAAGWIPDRVVTGTLARQRDTLEAMGFASSPEEHGGFNEYDFEDLLKVRLNGNLPEIAGDDRKEHFRILRETVFEWQDALFSGARETYIEFAARVEAARVFATDTKAKRVLVVSSGGVIGQLTMAALGAPVRQMMSLNLQVKNTSMTRFVFSSKSFSLHEFNATPHFMTPDGVTLISYS